MPAPSRLPAIRPTFGAGPRSSRTPASFRPAAQPAVAPRLCRRCGRSFEPTLHESAHCRTVVRTGRARKTTMIDGTDLQCRTHCSRLRAEQGSCDSRDSDVSASPQDILHSYARSKRDDVQRSDRDCRAGGGLLSSDEPDAQSADDRCGALHARHKWKVERLQRRPGIRSLVAASRQTQSEPRAEDNGGKTRAVCSDERHDHTPGPVSHSQHHPGSLKRRDSKIQRRSRVWEGITAEGDTKNLARQPFENPTGPKRTSPSVQSRPFPRRSEP